MPIRFNDAKLGSLYTNFETQKRTDPNLKLGQDQVLQLVALVGDGHRGWSGNKVAAELNKPGMTRDQQVALVKGGMTANEKKDLAAILDQGTVPLEPSAKQFLEAVLDRGAPQPPPPPRTNGLAVSGDQKNGLTGTAKAGATIEAINISTAPGGRLHMDDTTVIGKADANGAFTMARLTGDQAMREGDLIRMRARNADGSTSDWVTIKATGIASKDTNNATVALFRIGLADVGNGKVSVSNINESRQVSEPGAQLELTNKRTGEKTKVTVTETGGFPAGFTVNGKPGDSFAVAASDGVNNTNFAGSVGNVTVPGGAPSNTDLIPDPALHRDELDAAGKPRFSKVNFTGPLFVDGAKAEDVRQGQIGDCYFPAAIAAIAKSNPEAINKLIKDNGDGTYTVTFKQRDWNTQGFKDVAVKVDGDLWARSYGGALYGHSTNSSDPKKMELWFPLVEKAYAQWKGSYNEIGDGGHSSDVFEAVLGRDGNSMNIYAGNLDRVFDTIKKNIDARQPLAAGTYHDEARYTNTGVYGDHAYSILGYEQQGTERFVILRNPWGESEPAGNGANDGVFKLKLEAFAKLYQNLMYTS
ncbi:MAG: C2 family cysteine protease [Myxococcales bacterium]|nr:C2 family cysteine protease [Myxococcales bacterium]